MKKIPKKIALVFFISLVFCNDDKKYSLIPNIPEVGTKIKYHFVEEIYFDLPGKGRFEHVSKFDNITEYMASIIGAAFCPYKKLNDNRAKIEKRTFIIFSICLLNYKIPNP